jgi:hypothetical protein
LSSCDDSIGVSVSAANDEITTAAAIVSPNSRKSAPITPLWKMIGRKTATSASVVAMTAR